MSSDGALPDAGDVLFGPVVSLAAYLFLTVISILKPWGLTRRGQKIRTTLRKRVDAGAAGRTA